MVIIDSPSGHVVKQQTGYSAFIPHPLPPQIEWDTELVNSLSRADYLLGKLAREGSRLPNPHLMMRPFIAREAVLSSKIEGTQATIGDILAQEAGANVKHDAADMQEVQNYILALNSGLKLLSEVPLSLRLIKSLHQTLMQGVRGSHATPGEFRKSQNWIGSPGCTLNTAKYVPPPVENLTEILGDFESYLHNYQLPGLVHIALCHYQFEAIHPFLDGNGRVGRLLITVLMIERALLPSPLLYLSAFFEATRDEYYRQLFNVSHKGTWSDWLMYFLNGVAIQSEDVLSRAERINGLLQKWTLQMAGSGSKTALQIIQHFATNPYLTTKKIAEDLQIAFSTALRGVQKLESEGIIIQVNSQKREKVFCARALLDILEEPTKVSLG